MFTFFSLFLVFVLFRQHQRHLYRLCGSGSSIYTVTCDGSAHTHTRTVTHTLPLTMWPRLAPAHAHTNAHRQKNFWSMFCRLRVSHPPTKLYFHLKCVFEVAAKSLINFYVRINYVIFCCCCCGKASPRIHKSSKLTSAPFSVGS